MSGGAVSAKQTMCARAHLHTSHALHCRYLGKVSLTPHARRALATLPRLTHLHIIGPDGTRCVGTRARHGPNVAHAAAAPPPSTDAAARPAPTVAPAVVPPSDSHPAGRPAGAPPPALGRVPQLGRHAAPAAEQPLLQGAERGAGRPSLQLRGPVVAPVPMEGVEAAATAAERGGVGDVGALAGSVAVQAPGTGTATAATGGVAALAATARPPPQLLSPMAVAPAPTTQRPALGCEPLLPPHERVVGAAPAPAAPLAPPPPAQPHDASRPHRQQQRPEPMHLDLGTAEGAAPTHGASPQRRLAAAPAAARRRREHAAAAEEEGAGSGRGGDDGSPGVAVPAAGAVKPVAAEGAAVVVAVASEHQGETGAGGLQVSLAQHYTSPPVWALGWLGVANAAV